MARRQKILVVDDDRFNAALMREICENAGYLVIEAHDGYQAVELAQAEAPDLVLLDIMMGTKDGFQVCRELRGAESTAETPIILVTAVDDLDSKVRGIELGADDYVTKPFRLFDLQTRIRSAIDTRRMLRDTDADQAAEQAAEASRQSFRVGGYRQLRWDLEYEYNRARRYDHPLACALLVVENYEALYTDQRKKEAAGLIAAVVTVLQRTLRSVDRIYRIEDDVFIVVMPETGGQEAQVPVKRILDRLSAEDASTTGAVKMVTTVVSMPDRSIGHHQDILRLLTERLSQTRTEAP